MLWAIKVIEGSFGAYRVLLIETVNPCLKLSLHEVILNWVQIVIVMIYLPCIVLSGSKYLIYTIENKSNSYNLVKKYRVCVWAVQE